ncbi:hypothetical protein N7457_006897 [Penicillium paradoxum]|uniref:uncharacterized protein n=1 Tax=Penicillium paradoxum TaxID=176176 RepID=UPI002546E9D8|nr:uncharacterized protein N7457_006897 [Penicillium paradoxum]KAJ5779177.1 hypothetical protein N7457_006897 [Penicillium paradoxum]
MLYSCILPLLLAYGLVCSAQPVEKRQSTESFKLYAYGENISGLPVFYSNGTAEIADSSKVDTTRMTSIDCKRRSFAARSKTLDANNALVTASNDSPSTWTAHPTSSSNDRVSALSTNTLYLGQGDESNEVGFTGTSETERSNKLSNVWSLYGNYVLVSMSGANFYARPTGTDGLYSLLWSTSAETMTDYIPLTLRTIEPATESVLN